MCSFVLMKNGKEVDKNTAKGVKKSVVQKEITHNDSKDCLFSERPQQHEMSRLQSTNHEMVTQFVTLR